MQNKGHNTIEGLLNIVSLKAFFKKGLSILLINAFPSALRAHIKIKKT
jgi:hypothetical protein